MSGTGVEHAYCATGPRTAVLLDPVLSFYGTRCLILTSSMLLPGQEGQRVVGPTCYGCSLLVLLPLSAYALPTPVLA